MTAYELVIKTNHYMIKDGKLQLSQKANIVRQLLFAKSNENVVKSFKKGVNAPEYLYLTDQSSDSRAMYPLFFIPPYNGGKKLQTVIPMSPKTHILSANAYELEIIRLLHIFEPENIEIEYMVKKTLERLKTTCYGYHDCHQGECFHTALIVLRFLSAVSPEDTDWISKLIRFFNLHMEDKLKSKSCHHNVLWYYWLCLSELPFNMALPEILKYKENIVCQLKRSSVMNSEADKINHPVMIFAIRNALSRLPEYEYIKERKPYLNERDNRLHFDMD